MLERGLVTQADLAAAQEHSARADVDLAEALVSLNIVSEADAYATLSAAAGADLVEPEEITPSELALRLVPERLARRHLVLPLSVDNRTLRYATCRPFSAEAESDLQFATGRRTTLVVARRNSLLKAVDRCYATKPAADAAPLPVRPAPPAERSEPAATGAVLSATVERCQQIVARAASAGASEIEIDCDAAGGTVRHLVAGKLDLALKLPAAMAVPIRDQFKTMARIAVAVRTRPQEGGFRVVVQGHAIDVRLATQPVPGGERIVMRVLGQSAVRDLASLGYDEATLNAVRSALAAPSGLVVLAGPAASGITTALYAAAAYGHSLGGREVVSIEDPIERTIPGVTQIAANGRTGHTVAAALRSMLLRPPALIVVDKLWDDEVVQIAIQAVRNGHLVVSSIAADDAAAAVGRLTDLALDAGKVARCLSTVVAQRLVRTICERCRVVPRNAAARAHGRQPAAATCAPGCAQCKHTGYGARVMVAEVLTASAPVRDAIARRAGAGELRAMRAAESASLRDGALRLAAEGTTTTTEVDRVLGTAAERAPVRTQGARRILAADDEPMTRALVRSVLRTAGFDLLEAATGQQAIEIARRHSPDLLLIDLNMPEMDGYETIRRLRTDPEYAGLPILVLTAEDGAGVERRVLELGADDYIVKPFDPGVLVSRVNALFRRMRLIAA
jgi:type II secretory ATPase GspE/PulE/Tfp pilus assembly ATPase PilB-like protein/ActR/RegA family two-component response regulator